MTFLGAHWVYWAGLAVALVLGGLEIARRVRHRRRVWLAALLEQGRRETSSRVAYRSDQRLNAIQQRLSRTLGKKALSKATRKKIKRGLGE